MNNNEKENMSVFVQFYADDFEKRFQVIPN